MKQVKNVRRHYLQDNENTTDIPEKENKPPGSFLTKRTVALTKELGSSKGIGT